MAAVRHSSGCPKPPTDHVCHKAERSASDNYEDVGGCGNADLRPAAAASGHAAAEAA